MGLTRITEPVNTPVSVTEIKTFLRIDHDDDDTLLELLIKSATDLCENYTKRSFITQTWVKTLEQFPYWKNASKEWWDGVREIAITSVNEQNEYIKLDNGPLQSVTSVLYYDDGNNELTFSSTNYYLDQNSFIPRLILNDGSVWPATTRDYNAVKITYVTGFGDSATDIPEAIRQAVQSVVANLYEHRGDDSADHLPKIAKVLLEPYKVVQV